MFEGGDVDPRAQHPALAAALDAIPVEPARGLGGDDVLADTRSLLALRRLLDARILRRLAAVDEQGLAEADGCSSTVSWVMAVGRLDATPSAGLVAAARATSTLPVLGELLAQGKVGVEHVTAVSRSTRRLPSEVVAEHGETIAELAAAGTPGQLGLLGRALQTVHDDTQSVVEPDYARSQRYFSMASTFDGAWHLEGLLDPEAGATLQAALAPLARPRGSEDTRTAGQRRADALVELGRLGLASGRLPITGGDRTRLTLMVRVPDQSAAGIPVQRNAGSASRTGAPATAKGASTTAKDASTRANNVADDGLRLVEPDPVALLGQVLRDGETCGGGALVTGFGQGAATLIGLDTPLPWPALARISCNADVAVLTTTAHGDPLRLGRTRRTTNITQDRALLVRDGGCVFPYCNAPPGWCQAHHLKFWLRDLGPTDIENLALVCGFHHHLIHDGGWVLAREDPDPLTGAPPRWLATDPAGRTLVAPSRVNMAELPL